MWYLNVREIEVKAAVEVLRVGKVETKATADKSQEEKQGGKVVDLVVRQGSTVFEFMALKVERDKYNSYEF